MRGKTLAIVALLAVTGCAAPAPGPQTSPTPTTSKPSNTLPAVSFSRTGGIAGFQDELRITAAGQVTATTRQSGTRQGTLTTGERTELLAGLQKFALAATPSKPPRAIPDGFSYVITVDGHSARFGDPSIPQQARELIDVFSRILNRVTG